MPTKKNASFDKNAHSGSSHSVPKIPTRRAIPVDQSVEDWRSHAPVKRRRRCVTTPTTAALPHQSAMSVTLGSAIDIKAGEWRRWCGRGGEPVTWRSGEEQPQQGGFDCYNIRYDTNVGGIVSERGGGDSERLGQRVEDRVTRRDWGRHVGWRVGNERVENMAR